VVEQEDRSVWDKQSPNGIHYQIRWRVTPNNWIVTKDTEQNLMSISGISVRTSSLVVTNRSASEEQVGHPSALHQPGLQIPLRLAVPDSASILPGWYHPVTSVLGLSRCVGF
jgi:hypothetical protein